MKSVGEILLDKEILLESGTNELEVLVFNVAEFCFGINVAKVREVLPRGNITSLAKAHPSVRGVFRLRDQVVPCVSLVDHLGITPKAENSESTLILTDFNQQQTAFLVDSVERIHRLSWEQILSMPPLSALRNTPVTAVVRCDGRLVVMLDFEMVIDQVTNQAYRAGVVANTLNLPREQLRIVMCDDSPTIRQAVGETMRASGYTQLEIFENGAQVWQWMERRLAETSEGETIADLVISDVEMPQVDGLHLTKRIKENPRLRNLPVLLYSSIVTQDNHKKGAAVGADMQISKPELSKVVGIADQLIAARRDAASGGAAPHLTAALPKSLASAPAAPPAAPFTAPPATAAPASLAPVSPPIAVAESTPTPSKSLTPSVTASPTPSNAPAAKPAQAKASAKTPAAKSAPVPLLAPCPRGVNPGIWQTFRTELADHAAHLIVGFQLAAAGELDDELSRELFRTLHTIKSASMVVPIEPVTRATHAVESILAPLRKTPDAWPHERLSAYVQWIESLANPMIDVDAALAPGGIWEKLEIGSDAAFAATRR